MIQEQLKGKSDTEQSNIKAQAIKQEMDKHLTSKNLFIKDKKGRAVEIEQDAIGKLTSKGFERDSSVAEPVWFKIKVDGKYINGDGWYGFVNPPIMVPDGTEREEEDPFTKEKIKVPNLKEDLYETTMNMILRAIGGDK